jgi:hypothetical protein
MISFEKAEDDHMSSMNDTFREEQPEHVLLAGTFRGKKDEAHINSVLMPFWELMNSENWL